MVQITYSMLTIMCMWKHLVGTCITHCFRSNTAVTIYFVNEFCVANTQGWRLLKSGDYFTSPNFYNDRYLAES